MFKKALIVATAALSLTGASITISSSAQAAGSGKPMSGAMGQPSHKKATVVIRKTTTIKSPNSTIVKKTIIRR